MEIKFLYVVVIFEMIVFQLSFILLLKDLFATDLYSVNKQNEKENEILEKRFVDSIDLHDSKKLNNNHLKAFKNFKCEETITMKKTDHDKLLNDLNKLKEECEHYRRDKKIR